MAKGRKPALASDDGSVGQGRPSRSAYLDGYYPDFKKCLDRFGKDKSLRGRAVAKLQSFMRDWQGGLSETELYRRWDFKQLHGKAVEEQEVKQIHLLKDYRATLVLLHTTRPPRVWFLDVYPKGAANEQTYEHAAF